MKKIILISGGQRSGKSSYAESLALSMSEHPIYVATARVWDKEFASRIQKHKDARGPMWVNIEEEKQLSNISLPSSNNLDAKNIIVIDCVTLWATNFYYDTINNPINIDYSVKEILEKIKEEFNAFTSKYATFIFVTNEIGLGGVSPNKAQREFTDILGWLNQYIASKADEVVLMISGIPVKIK